MQYMLFRILIALIESIILSSGPGNIFALEHFLHFLLVFSFFRDHSSQLLVFNFLQACFISANTIIAAKVILLYQLSIKANSQHLQLIHRNFLCETFFQKLRRGQFYCTFCTQHIAESVKKLKFFHYLGLVLSRQQKPFGNAHKIIHLFMSSTLRRSVWSPFYSDTIQQLYLNQKNIIIIPLTIIIIMTVYRYTYTFSGKVVAVTMEHLYSEVLRDVDVQKRRRIFWENSKLFFL